MEAVEKKNYFPADDECVNSAIQWRQQGGNGGGFEKFLNSIKSLGSPIKRYVGHHAGEQRASQNFGWQLTDNKVSASEHRIHQKKR